MSLTESLSLAKFGFNHREKTSTLNNFSRQLESYALHVIEDKPVSNIYTYFVNGNEIYIDKERSARLLVDDEERGGFVNLGTKRAINLALTFSGKLVLFYSPPGPVAFESGTKYDETKPYTDGQIYLLTSNSSATVKAIAVSVGQENESKPLRVFLAKTDLKELMTK